jgi:hypothetical protein
MTSRSLWRCGLPRLLISSASSCALNGREKEDDAIDGCCCGLPLVLYAGPPDAELGACAV